MTTLTERPVTTFGAGNSIWSVAGVDGRRDVDVLETLAPLALELEPHPTPTRSMLAISRACDSLRLMTPRMDTSESIGFADRCRGCRGDGAIR